MDEQKIRSIVQQELQANRSGARFGLTPIQRHIHNNTDSPFAFQPILTYTGVIIYDGTVGSLPKGWTCVRNAVGAYSITHNLGSDSNYVVMTQELQSLNTVLTSVVSPFALQFDVTWWDISTAAAGDTSFMFTVTVANNRSTQIPVYSGTFFA